MQSMTQTWPMDRGRGAQGRITSALSGARDWLDERGRPAWIVAMILGVASGQETKSEALGLGDNEFLPWQIGAVV